MSWIRTRLESRYLPLAVEEVHGGLGCLPLLVVGVLALLVIVGMQG